MFATMNSSKKTVIKVIAMIAANVFATVFASARADDVQRVKLFVRETRITVNGRTINCIATLAITRIRAC